MGEAGDIVVAGAEVGVEVTGVATRRGIIHLITGTTHTTRTGLTPTTVTVGLIHTTMDIQRTRQLSIS